jgi:tetratricopeptide (TPR) repeat protein
MKNLVILTVILFSAFSMKGQTDEIENWRSAGYLAKEEGDYDAAIGFYQKILDYDHGDYDAKLALGRLYIRKEDYKTAISYFNEIYSNDSTDVEAMNGLGECYGHLGKDKESVRYYEESLSMYREDIMQYFNLAKAYGNGGELDRAIEVYREIITIDNTYSEAWAGIGKMYYWMGKPETAVVFYEKALELDPGNEEIAGEFQSVRSELDYALSISLGPVNETEEDYEIVAMISKIGFEKRIDDHFHVQAGFLLDYSNRDYSEDEQDTTRWYSNTRITGSWMTRHHTLSAFGGYSVTDNKFSSYGLNWKLNYQAGRVSVINSVNAGYDYFYYWNNVGSSSVTDELELSYRFLGLNARVTAGIVDAVTVIDYTSDTGPFTDQNPYQSYGISLFFKFLRNPVIKTGINYSYLDYKYKSPMYYSPFGRNLTGASISLYYNISKFFIYGSFAYNIGSEYNFEESDSGEMEQNRMNVDNWSANLELGYDFYPVSFSVGASNFYNPYYQNLTGFIALKILL